MTITKAFMARLGLIVVCGSIAGGCLYTINASFDPLARYPYTLTEKQQATILKYMSSDDIDYMIDSQLEPDDFMDFISVDGFVLKYTKYYKIAMNAQKATPEEVVNFVNKYRSHFSKETLKNALLNYSYQDLINFFETEQVLNPNLELEVEPANSFLVLSETTSVYKYVPENLVDFNGIKVQSFMVDDLTNMMTDYKTTLGIDMQFMNGYKSYEDLTDDFRIHKEASEYVKNILFPAGSNEEQLGYTLVLVGQDDWLEKCIEYYKDEQVDYSKVYNACSQELKDSISWLEENAYQYGFVIRYTENKVDTTKLWYQPFVLRYVGKKAAKTMEQKELVMEEMNFDDVELK